LKFGKHTQFTQHFYQNNLMGPSSVRILDELCQRLQLSPGSRILDLGCGTALTSIYLAKEFGAQVFATDLWISPTANYERIRNFALEDRIIPIHADASAHRMAVELNGEWGTIPDTNASNGLPFANGYFDAIISIDAYYYFGTGEDYLDKQIAPMLKNSGILAVSTPGLKKEFAGNVPEEMKPFWIDELNATFHDMDWWKSLWSHSQAMRITDTFTHTCHALAWEDWLASDNLYAVGDKDMMKAENGRYFTTHALIAQKQQ
jgi:cyclopropane fatty-acyl-phospholipid synthase-like methyltransferase